MQNDSIHTPGARFGHDFSQVALRARGPAAGTGTVTVHGSRTFEVDSRSPHSVRIRDSRSVHEKNVEGGERELVEDNLAERAPAENDGGAPAPAQAPLPAKKAGVQSFVVKWSKNAGASASNASLRLDYTAKFKKDANHDPALADFRQSVMSTWDITAGTHKGRKGTTAPMHDDNYSRGDDTAGNARTDVNFVSNDNPGWTDLDASDVLDYSFTAEQTIIDTSQSNLVIATRGPHTGTVTGNHPRAYGGVPKTLS